MTGTLLNVAGIVAGGAVGLARKRPLPLRQQLYFKAVLGALTVFFGLRLTWMSLSGPFLQGLKQLVILLVALGLGKLTGRLLRLQKTSNRLGRFAQAKMLAAKPANPGRFNDGFNVCAILFCAAPLGILGAVCDGLTVNSATPEYFYPLAVKSVVDGLATMSFVTLFGPGVMLAAAPVLVFQGSITVVCARMLRPFLESHHALVDPVNATCGLLIFCVALIIFEIKKIEVADYLPSLAYAPLLTLWLQ